MKKKWMSFVLALMLCAGLTTPVSAAKVSSVAWLDENLGLSGVIGVEDGMMGVFDKETGLCGFVDSTGKLVISPRYDDIWCFSEGLAAVSIAKDNDFPKWGFIDKTGKLVIPAKYEIVNEFSEGVAPVSNGEYWEFIDETGKTEFPMQFDFAYSFHNGYAIVEKDGYQTIIDRNGNFVLPLEYKSVSHISEDGIFTCIKNGQWWIMSTNGTVAIPLGTKYTSVGGFNNETGLAHVATGYFGSPHTYGWIDKTGKVVIPMVYTDSKFGFSEGLAAVKRGNVGWGYINKDGETVIPFGYKDANIFVDGLACVAVETGSSIKYGYIDSVGQMIISAEYDKAYNFYDGFAVVQKNGRYGILSLNDTPTTTVSTIGGFTDVKPTDYFADAVLWAVEKNITSGTNATTFSPGATCNRAQILTFLWRANGSPEPTAANPFTDINSADYYYKAALWAAEKGLVSGSTFGGGTDCTRAMTVEYLWKAAGSPTAAKQASFNDVPASAEYAQAVAWAVENGITSGTGGGNFSPAATCTRGQIVTFLHRAMS